MFISKFKQWLDEVDPYALQRITLYKAFLIATIEVYIYWIFQPAYLMAFIAPFFLVSLYESPALSSFKEREQLLIFIAVAVLLINISFYLVYPFKGVFFFFSVLVLAITYFCVLNYFYVLKNLTMLLLATGVLVLSTDPPANLQVAYGLFSATALAMTIAFICLRFFPNMYLIVWNRSLQKFIECLELDIECALSQKQESPTGEEILHLGMVRNYRRMVPKKYMMQTYRIAVGVRNIQHALDNLYYENKNEVFWYGIKNNLYWLRIKMKTNIPCDLPNMPIEPDTQLQHYVVHCLQQAFIHWNKLCSLQQH
jgi:hypothetical protein